MFEKSRSEETQMISILYSMMLSTSLRVNTSSIIRYLSNRSLKILLLFDGILVETPKTDTEMFVNSRRMAGDIIVLLRSHIFLALELLIKNKTFTNIVKYGIITL